MDASFLNDLVKVQPSTLKTALRNPFRLGWQSLDAF